MFAINVKRKARRKLEKLTPKQKENILQIIELLKDDPIPFRKADVSKLKGCNDTYRIRIGEHRIIYQIQWKKRTILIIYAGPREKAYQ